MSAAVLRGAVACLELLQTLDALPEQLKPGYARADEADDAIDFDFRGGRALIEHELQADDRDRRQGFVDALTWYLMTAVRGVPVSTNAMIPAQSAVEVMRSFYDMRAAEPVEVQERKSPVVDLSASCGEVCRDAVVTVPRDRHALARTATWHLSAMLTILYRVMDEMPIQDEVVSAARMQTLGVASRIEQLNSVVLSMLDEDGDTDHLMRVVHGRAIQQGVEA